MATEVRFEGVKLGYVSEVISNATFEAVGPCLFVVLGPNGSGKTTILRSMIKVVKPICGRILIDGRNITEISIGELPDIISYAPADFDDQMWMSALNIIMSAKMNGRWIKKGEALYAMKEMGIDDLAYAKFAELSTGQKRLVVLARAFASKAQIVLLDEPTSGLDMRNKSIVKRHIMKMSKRCTVIAATHDMELARDSDRIIALVGGKAIGAGDPREVLTEVMIKRIYGL